MEMVKDAVKRLKDNVMGTEEQNKAAQERMDKMDKKNPESTQAKVNRAIDGMTGRKRQEEAGKGYKNGGMVVLHKGKNC